MTTENHWDRYRRYCCRADEIGLEVDISRMDFQDSYLEGLSASMDAALEAMELLEKGAIANADEKQMVGHYWLRAPERAPEAAMCDEIRDTVERIRRFAGDVHTGVVSPERGDGFFVILVIGIGGSSLGAQFVTDVLSDTGDATVVRFIDNTDPDGIDRIVAELDEAIEQTLVVVVSKSGGTVETRNGMLEVMAAYEKAGLSFARHAVAITVEGSELHRQAETEHWLRIFPMWKWVGGRTSVCSAAGLLPAALQGNDVEAFLAGARQCDEVTRNRDWRRNPAALLAAMWHYGHRHRSKHNLVVIPYRDRLAFLGRYLQQLIMESLGKEFDRHGNTVNQGITVYGNKGSTDQHAYVQQLRDGMDDFFAMFIRVLRDRSGPSICVDVEATSGDYLRSFWQGTRQALSGNGRESITVTLDRLDARSLGAFIALFERTVGLYAELIDVNAYHQPGVEAGKNAANHAIELQRAILAHLRGHGKRGDTAERIAAAIGADTEVETVYNILRHLAANEAHRVVLVEGEDPAEARYGVS